MRTLSGFTVLFLCTVAISPAVLAQDVNGQISGAKQAQQAAGARQAVASSFEALRPVLKVGQEVKVRDESGRTTLGKVVSISSDQLVISRRRFFRRSVKVAFGEDVARTIHVVDSALDGLLLGMTPGLIASWVSCGSRSASNLCGLVPLGMLVIGMPVGVAIDEAITKRVYDRQSQMPRVTISPLLGRDQKGVVARVYF